VEHDCLHVADLLAPDVEFVFMSDFGKNVNRMPPIASARSLLFAPGNDERKLRKALDAGADVVVADLEDAVPAAEKDTARGLVLDVLAEAATESVVAVRVNGHGTPYWADDLAAVSRLDLGAVVLPKATPEAVSALGGSGPPVLAIIETAVGVRRAYETTSARRVAGLVLGAVDLGLELSLEPRADGQEILLVRSQLVLDSAAAGIRGPFDLVHLDTRDDEGLEAECRLARSLGLRGKVCIHPRQVDIVNRVFAPDDGSIERARRVVEAYERGLGEGRGAVAIDGVMVDLPVVERARRILADAERSTPHGN
jgi:citrate lyase beta subunit